MAKKDENRLSKNEKIMIAIAVTGVAGTWVAIVGNLLYPLYRGYKETRRR